LERGERMYCIENGKINELETYEYKSENELQKMLFENPEIFLSIPELEIDSSKIFLIAREYSVSSGYIDLLVINEHADIIIVETKLFRNPESSRKVIAQVIDYIKTFAQISIDELISQLDSIKDKQVDEDLKNDDRFLAVLKKNIEKGNITGIILGDDINSNLLEMVSSIQSAPHLAFSIVLISLETVKKDQVIILNPTLLSRTNEIERSVINISIDINEKTAKVIAQTPERKGKGSKPIISWEEFLANFDDKERISIFDKFHKNWLKIDAEGFNMGTVGFSAGIIKNGVRIPIQYAYSVNMELWTQKKCKSLDLKDSLYDAYKRSLESQHNLYDKYVIANKTYIEYSNISNSELNAILQAAINVAERIKKEDI
jgi:hypothetical protein